MDMQTIVQNLRSERDFLLAQPYVTRVVEHQLTKQMSTDLITVITGPRRAGKSLLGIHALRKEQDFVYINFDTLDITEELQSYNFIVELSTYFKNNKILFLDEIQNVNKFELLVSQLQRNGYTVIMTGSNANLLSKELATHLTGRYTQVEVFPFSYFEAQKLIPELSFMEYLRLGGFPEQLKLKGAADRYLETLFESIVLKDIVARYGVRNTYDLIKLSRYLITTPSQNSNYTRLKNKLDIGSVNTLIDFYSYLREAYLIYDMKHYSRKSSEIVKSDFKTYIIDTGMFTANANTFEQTVGYLFENSIFIELVRRGNRPNIDFFQLENADDTQVDFYIQKRKRILIQSCLSVRDNTTRAREFRGIQKTGVEYDEAYVIVLDASESKLSDSTVRVVGIEDWLKNV